MTLAALHHTQFVSACLHPLPDTHDPKRTMSNLAADPALIANPRSRTYLVRVETVNVTESNKRTTTKTLHLNEETGEILYVSVLKICHIS